MTLNSWTFHLHLPSAGTEKGYHQTFLFVHLEADVDLDDRASDLLTYMTGQESGYS